MRYEVKLTDQEELELRQMLMGPGFPVLLKFLQIKSLNAQADAMECKGNKDQRLLVLLDAQAMAKISNELTRELAQFRRVPGIEISDEESEIISNLWKGDKN